MSEDNKNPESTSGDFFVDYQSHLEQQKTETDKSGISVALNNVNVSVKTKEFVNGDQNEGYPTVFSEGPIGKIKKRIAKREVIETKILDNVSCEFNPKRMTLVFGSNQSGVSSLFKSVSSQLAPNVIKSGTVSFRNGENCAVLKKKYVRNICSYVPENDLHNSVLTVKETFSFARKCQSKTKDETVTRVINSLGLNICEDTIVGDQMYRGVSGGEKRRVTVGEMLLGPQRVLLLDNITTGLDSAVALDINKMLRLWSDTLNGVVVASLLQPEPEVLALYDDVLLLDQGRVLYHGPINEAEEYFQKAGFPRPEDSQLGDFLLDMSSAEGRGKIHEKMLLSLKHECIERDGFEKLLDSIGRVSTALSSDIVPVVGKAAKELINGTEFQKEFGMSFFMSLFYLLVRQLKLVFRDRGYIKGRTIQMTMMGIIMGTIFFDLQPEDFIARTGLIFFSAMFISMGAMAQISVVFNQKSIFYRQRDSGFFHTTSFAVSGIAVQFIISLVETLLMGTILYWLSNMANDFTSYCRFILTIYILALCVAALFRFAAAIMPNEIVAQFLASMMTLIFMIYSGLFLTVDNIQDWLKWIYYINPISYALLANSINEFRLSGRYDTIFAGTSKTQGEVYMATYGLETDKDWYLYSVAILCLMLLVYTIFTTLSLHFIRPSGRLTKKSTMDSEENVKRQKALAETTTATPTGSEPNSRTTSEIDLDVENIGHGLPFAPIDFTFAGVCYDVDVKVEKTKTKKRLLNGINGFVKSGSMTALMGASGAGKTTLIDVLAMRKTAGYIKGEFRMNGKTFDKKTLDNVSGYVEQSDALAALDTVKEILEFNAKLRLPTSVTEEQRALVVKEVIDTLRLQPYVDLLVGTKEVGLPLSIRKLVSVGVELVANPSIIFLDEPTTGLDATSAEIVVKALQRIARAGRSIICTIHQPSPVVFARFQEVLLLQRGGEIAYFGDQSGTSAEDSKLVQFLENCEGVAKHEAGVNVASWMLDVTGAGVNSSKTNFAEFYRKSDLYEKNENTLNKLHNESVLEDVKVHDSPGFFTQCGVLGKRMMKFHWRSPEYNVTRGKSSVVVALILGLSFYNISNDGISGMQSTAGFINVAGFFFGMATMNTSIPFYMKLRPSLYREIDTHAYGVIPYSIMSALVELPYLIMATTAYSAICYYLAGLQPAFSHFIFFWMVICALQICLLFFSNMLTVFAPTFQVGLILAIFLVANWNVLAGLLIPRPEIPDHWLWWHHCSPLRYWFEAIVVDQFKCSGVNCPTVSIPRDGTFITVTKDKYLDLVLGLDVDSQWIDLAILIGIAFVLRIIATIGMKKIRHMSR
eukprot:TRINITY_DN4770_c0_g1_i2.p1 TRINITY_DN4770_c0_g1~~TRINITY_DN4770_c0_g1_i2.p1  ORF type:complete len:1323 (+),score=438.91 TRINITY_DN4770_c0_g1_i2:94-4062(+)